MLNSCGYGVFQNSEFYNFQALVCRFDLPLSDANWQSSAGGDKMTMMLERQSTEDFQDFFLNSLVGGDPYIAGNAMITFSSAAGFYCFQRRSINNRLKTF